MYRLVPTSTQVERNRIVLIVIHHKNEMGKFHTIRVNRLSLQIIINLTNKELERNHHRKQGSPI